MISNIKHKQFAFNIKVIILQELTEGETPVI